MTTAIERSKELARDFQAADQWDKLWDELENLWLPTGGTMADYFQNRRMEIQRSMTRSTNLVEIEKSVRGLKNEFKRYCADISDDLNKVNEAFGPSKRSPVQQRFFPLIADSLGIRRLMLPQEYVPREYWQGLPDEVLQRLRKLGDLREMLEEMKAYAAEESNLRNLETRHPASRAAYDTMLPPYWAPKEHLKLTDFANQIGMSADRIPWTYRHIELSPELQKRLVARTFNVRGPKEGIVMGEVRQYESEERERRRLTESIQSRRRVLDGQPTVQPPLQIEIVPSQSPGFDSQTPNLPLTSDPQWQIKPIPTGKGNQ